MKFLIILIIFIISIVGKSFSLIRTKNVSIKSNISQNINNQNTITNDFEINGYSYFNGKDYYSSSIHMDDNEVVSLQIDASDFNLPSCLYNYRDDIRFRLTYSTDDNTVYDCKIINYLTNEVITDISEENINKLFNIEYEKTIVEKQWTDKINLSELEENVIYKYIATEATQVPQITNDIEDNCIIYFKDHNKDTYERDINMFNTISGNSFSFSYNEFNEGETFNIMYRKIENDELLKLIKSDEIIHLSNYNSGDELSYSFEKYIYNDTQNDITILTKDTAFNIEDSKSFIIESGKIYGFSWMIDSVSIEY